MDKTASTSPQADATLSASPPARVADAPESTAALDVRSFELATFLRGRREQLRPEDVGLPTTRRRRTPGLRREEVAELADISTSLYTWLEQGRNIPVSKRTVEALATALRLSRAQRRHLTLLASPQDIALDETVSPALHRFVESMRAHPVFVLDHAWDILLRNRTAIAVFCNDLADASVSTVQRDNFLEHIFLDPNFRVNSGDWPGLAADIVAIFRHHFAAYTADSRAIAVVQYLQKNSAFFAEHWERHHDIRESPYKLRPYQHPLAGVLNFEQSVYTVIESRGLWLLIFTPLDAQTTARVEELVSVGSLDGGA